METKPNSIERMIDFIWVIQQGSLINHGMDLGAIKSSPSYMCKLQKDHYECVATN